jgi:tetratricopeptide (TPR) repeat protein
LPHADEWEAAIQEAWVWLSHCMVIATSARPLGSWQGVEIDCPPLDEEDTIILFDYFFKRHPSPKQPPTDSLYDYLWDLTGGNPRTLRNYFRAWIAGLSDEPIHEPASQDNIKAIWQYLPNTSRQLWLFIDLLTIAHNRLDHQQLIADTEHTLSVPRETVEVDIEHLIQVGLIEQHTIDSRGKSYRIPDDIREAVVKNALTKPLFTDHLDRLLLLADSAKELSFGFLQQIFMLPFEISNLSRWLPSAHEHIRMLGQWDNWLYFVETLLQTHKLSQEDVMWFELEAITALRWLGQFDEALHRLELFISQANKTADKRIIGAGYIEKANLLFYKNYIHQSLEAAYDAHQWLSPIEKPASDLMQRNQAAIIRVLIESQPDEAQLWLDRVVGQSPAILNLVVELELKRGNIGQALLAAKRVLTDLSEDDPNYSRAHNILAKVLVAAEQFNKAVDQFALAINLLQPKKDLVALARLYNNRSVALMYEGELDESEENVQSSLMLHKDLEDLHGWNIARENLQLIHDLRDKGFRSLRDSDFPSYSSKLL